MAPLEVFRNLIRTQYGSWLKQHSAFRIIADQAIESTYRGLAKSLRHKIRTLRLASLRQSSKPLGATLYSREREWLVIGGSWYTSELICVIFLRRIGTAPSCSGFYDGTASPLERQICFHAVFPSSSSFSAFGLARHISLDALVPFELDIALS